MKKFCKRCERVTGHLRLEFLMTERFKCTECSTVSEEPKQK